ncbi:hypothetical protein A1Q1_06124 [Trichosporon asahii var. asahii CBS 2479]|uniref:Alpha-acetolactate decarboxylase n=1 Tax=Trichosporon asahii var. asahii (strain ATCC 90039 / CBS 2479 / JCM 2466 / KCTC 7840 / NBRC 103889/ NCYC 2677 / UAMH 7654) TaxID=1186058 RepID=J5SF86_TRIAS|nr:hypothetical protein A1Q1_06124 [Trichosporon asahii var. asahii CBS 2479]EJT45361.1 hypothetical protein A1Q1_06124 [Trichosporon asahii var. asahii CBS 2479]
MKLTAFVTVAALLGSAVAKPVPHRDESDDNDDKWDHWKGNKGKGHHRHDRPWVKANELHQYSNIAALTEGVAANGTLIENVLKYGDLGLGTFGELRGEMIVVDGVVYHATADGQVSTPDPSETETPFMAVTQFEPEAEASVQVANMTDFSAQLPSWWGNITIRNQFVSYRLDGTFTLRIRAPPGQAYPMENLAGVSSRQVEWTHANIKGSMVGFHTPKYAGQINAAGDHLHFISEDRKIGGHVLEFKTEGEANIQLARMPSFHVEVPTDGQFTGIDLGTGCK